MTASESQSQSVPANTEEPRRDSRAFVENLRSENHSATRIQWSSALPKTAASGFATVALLTLIAAVTMPALSLLGLPLGGAFSVFLYIRGKDKGRITPGMGARLGAVSGLFAFAVWALIVAAELTSQRGEFLNTLRKMLQEAAAKNPNPQAQAMVQQVMTPEGLSVLLVLTAIVFLFTFLILSSLGGSAGAAILQGRRDIE